MTFCGDLPFVPSGIDLITFLRTFAARGITATAGNDCPVVTAKVFACFWAKTFAGCAFHPWTGGDGCGCISPRLQGLKQVNGTGHNNGQAPAATTRSAVCETASPLTSRRPLARDAGSAGHGATGGATGTVAASQGFASGMEARQGGDSFAGSVHAARPARGTPEKP